MSGCSRGEGFISTSVSNKLPLAGVAPIEASRGEVVRHRLSLAGNRRLNKVMHMIAACQARSDPRGGVYHRKKLAEGKSRREAMPQAARLRRGFQAAGHRAGCPARS